MNRNETIRNYGSPEEHFKYNEFMKLISKLKLYGVDNNIINHADIDIIDTFISENIPPPQCESCNNPYIGKNNGIKLSIEQISKYILNHSMNLFMGGLYEDAKKMKILSDSISKLTIGEVKSISGFNK